MPRTILPSDLESPDCIQTIAKEIRARTGLGNLRPHALYSRMEADSFTIWYELWLAAEIRGPTPEERARGFDLGREVAGKFYFEFHACDVKWTAGVRGERNLRIAGTRLAKELGVAFRLCHDPESDWVNKTPYEHEDDPPCDVPSSPDLPFAQFAGAVEALSLPPGFVQQLSCLDPDEWQRTEAQCRPEEFRTYQLLRENMSRIPRRSLVGVDVPGPASVLASLALAEMGWAPTFLLGPDLHLHWDWKPVVAALKYVSARLLDALGTLPEESPVALIGCNDAHTLNYRRGPNEPADLQPVNLEELPDWAAKILSSDKSKRDLANRAAVHRRAIFPSMAEIGALHDGAVWVLWSDVEEVEVFRYDNGLHADFFEAGIPVDGMLLNPFAGR